MTSKKISAKGKSISAVTVAEAMKSRTDSNERRLDAKEPTDAGLASRRIPSTRSMISAESFTSMRALARSMKCPRRRRIMKSMPNTSSRPRASIHKVSVALFGTTRSYTFIEKSGMTSANRLIRRAAQSTSRYTPDCSKIAPQNQCRWTTLPTSGARASKAKRGRAKRAMPR